MHLCWFVTGASIKGPPKIQVSHPIFWESVRILLVKYASLYVISQGHGLFVYVWTLLVIQGWSSRDSLTSPGAGGQGGAGIPPQGTQGARAMLLLSHNLRPPCV